MLLTGMLLAEISLELFSLELTVGVWNILHCCLAGITAGLLQHFHG
jgi:hypothetical protein